MKKFILAMVIVLALLPAAASASAIKWYPYEKGLERAVQEGKKVYIVFHTKSCGYCTMMKKTTFAASEVAEYLNDNYIPISIDAEENVRIAMKYGVRPVPVSFFLNPDGSSIGKRAGFMKPAQFLKIIKMVNEKN